MAKKKVVPIAGIPKNSDDKLIVQKSLPLFSLWRSKMTLSEFKIMDAYLARIDSEKPERRDVVFTKGELEELLRVKKINNQELNERLKHLMGNVVQIDDPSRVRGFRLVTLFEEAEAEQDKDGLWQVKLRCTTAARKYFFNIRNLGYLRYKLRCVTVLKSRYSYILFVYLEANRFRKTWEVAVDELKNILSCENDPAYSEFKRFNDLVLKRSHKELTEKTECHFSYETVKRGRGVAAIRFTLETLPQDVIIDGYNPDQMTFDQYALIMEDEDDPNRFEELMSLLSEACDNEFSREEVEELHDSMMALPFDFDDDLQRCDFLHRQYVKLKRQAVQNEKNGKPIKNRFTYLRSIVRKADDTNY